MSSSWVSQDSQADNVVKDSTNNLSFKKTDRHLPPNSSATAVFFQNNVNLETTPLSLKKPEITLL